MTPVDDVRLYCGDCLDVAPRVANRADAVIADLPYGTTNCRWDTRINLADLWEMYDRVCSGPVILFAQTPFDKVLGASNLKDLRYEWIWEKSHATGHLNAKKMPMKAHENILVFYKSLPTYNPQKTTGHTRKSAVKRADISSVYGRQEFHTLPYDSTDRYPRSVLRYPSDKQRECLHEAQKPVALLEYLIKTYTNPGDTILDNCMGSGSTLVACLNTGRKGVGIEIDPGVFAIAESRINRVREQSLIKEEMRG